jgi:pimeloyl-ACP methyl ester carboxylesterase
MDLDVDPEIQTCTFELPGCNRVLGYAVMGLPLRPELDARHTIIYSHGWPSGKMEGSPLSRIARAHGMRLLAIDKPGIGSSTYHRQGKLCLMTTGFLQ